MWARQMRLMSQPTNHIFDHEHGLNNAAGLLAPGHRRWHAECRVFPVFSKVLTLNNAPVANLVLPWAVRDSARDNVVLADNGRSSLSIQK